MFMDEEDVKERSIFSGNEIRIPWCDDFVSFQPSIPPCIDPTCDSLFSWSILHSLSLFAVKSKIPRKFHSLSLPSERTGRKSWEGVLIIMTDIISTSTPRCNHPPQHHPSRLKAHHEDIILATQARTKPSFHSLIFIFSHPPDEYFERQKD